MRLDSGRHANICVYVRYIDEVTLAEIASDRLVLMYSKDCSLDWYGFASGRGRARGRHGNGRIDYHGIN